MIGQEILRQLGGMGRLSAMLGAFCFSFPPDGVAFKFKAKALNGANFIRISLDPSDTYRVVFMSVRGGKVRKISEDALIYADQLADYIHSATGLYLSL